MIHDTIGPVFFGRCLFELTIYIFRSHSFHSEDDSAQLRELKCLHGDIFTWLVESFGGRRVPDLSPRILVLSSIVSTLRTHFLSEVKRIGPGYNYLSCFIEHWIIAKNTLWVSDTTHWPFGSVIIANLVIPAWPWEFNMIELNVTSWRSELYCWICTSLPIWVVIPRRCLLFVSTKLSNL